MIADIFRSVLRPRRSDDLRPLPARFVASATLVILALLVGVAVAFQVAGERSRWDPGTGITISVVDDARGAFDAWRAAGVRHARLVSVSSQLGFRMVVFGSEVSVSNSYPLMTVPYEDALVNNLRRENRLWVGAQTGLFRTIDHVMPREVFEGRVRDLRQRGARGIASDGSMALANDEGYLRRIWPSIPRVVEPVALEVDASYFETEEPGKLLAALDSSALDYRVVTLNRALDSTQTTQAARARLDEFHRLLEDRR